jgi:hypothetical protein
MQMPADAYEIDIVDLYPSSTHLTGGWGLAAPTAPIASATPDGLENAFSVLAAARPSALMTMPDGVFHSQAPRIAKLTTAVRLPACFPTSSSW